MKRAAALLAVSRLSDNGGEVLPSHAVPLLPVFFGILYVCLQARPPSSPPPISSLCSPARGVRGITGAALVPCNLAIRPRVHLPPPPRAWPPRHSDAPPLLGARTSGGGRAPPEGVTIFTDAQAAIRRMASEEIQVLQARKHIAVQPRASQDITIETRWYPAHTGASGNEKADGCAKLVAEKPDARGWNGWVTWTGRRRTRDAALHIPCAPKEGDHGDLSLHTSTKASRPRIK